MSVLRRATSPCCRAPWHWETFAGMRVHQDGVYRVRCPKCGHNYRVRL